MSDLTCTEVDEMATEYALGILAPRESHAVGNHLSGCPSCRSEVDEIRVVGDQLLDLIPDAEPPIGFDRKVLGSLRSPHRWRSRRVMMSVAAGAAAAAIAVVLLATTVFGGGTKSPHSGELTAALRHGNQTVGSIYIGGNPTWVTMRVQHAQLTGMVTCQLVGLDGTMITVGNFELVDGSGTWSAPDPEGASKMAGARLVGPDGTVLAAATFEQR